jgi:predicted transcriptional regulator
MRAKKIIRIQIRSVDEALADFVSTAESIKNGRKIQRETGVYFASLEAFRRAITPKRMQLLHTIREEKPSSLHELAKLLNRDIKNVSDDVIFLEQIGLIERKRYDNKTAPRGAYDEMQVKIAI